MPSFPQALLFRAFMLLSILSLAGLGTWQIHRKGEKEGLIAALQQNTLKAPQNVDEVGAPSLFQPLFAKGDFLPGKTMFLQAKVHKGKSGVFVLDVFRTREGKHLLVQRGWSPSGVRNQKTGVRTSFLTPDSCLLTPDSRIEGIARLPSPPTFFQPANTPPDYFWVEIPLLSREMGIPLLPYYIVAKESGDPSILPTDPIPPLRNHHLEYAITWYSLALALLCMLLYTVKYSKRKSP